MSYKKVSAKGGPAYGWKSQRGFSLVEMIVTIGVTGLTLLLILGAILFSIKVTLRTKHRTLAYQILEQEMEIVRNTPFDNLQNQTDGPFLGNIAEISNLPSASGSLTIENYQGQANIKLVKIKLSWQEGGATKLLSIRTLVTQGGIGP